MANILIIEDNNDIHELLKERKKLIILMDKSSGTKHTEAKQKLQKIQPETIAQASRISGVNPADISILMVYIEQGKIAKVEG